MVVLLLNEKIQQLKSENEGDTPRHEIEDKGHRVREFGVLHLLVQPLRRVLLEHGALVFFVRIVPRRSVVPLGCELGTSSPQHVLFYAEQRDTIFIDFLDHGHVVDDGSRSRACLRRPDAWAHWDKPRRSGGGSTSTCSAEIEPGDGRSQRARRQRPIERVVFPTTVY